MKNYLELPLPERKAIAMRRGKKIDRYIIGSLFVEILGVILVASLQHSDILHYVLLIISIFRIIDIIQVNVNLVVFDPLREPAVGNIIASGERALVNSVVNFFEIVLCFGLIYNFKISLLGKSDCWWNGFYFSTVTQTTLGYGDLSPSHQFKLVASIQVLIGYLFSALIIGRFISLLPLYRVVIKSDD